MAQISFDEAKKILEEKRGNDVVFLNSLVKNINDSVVVRFPYETTTDFEVERVYHAPVNGYSFNQFIECEDGKIVLDGDKEAKKVVRFLVKGICYKMEGETVNITPFVWNKATQFGKELENLINDNGSLRDILVKITRLDEKNCTITPLMNKTIYSDDVYIKDFSSLKDVEPKKLLIMSYSKYQEKMSA